ncbi:hypothetical protein OnM2_067005 [Erysiphe neolycopersici]|uniref:Uncharacterized protein n=1 Tax=Erysiphe neolycopersici TaxID=212602 RepID=A0A420HM66_9PEZI|nr:hypothetical protein OnM2_067005 [Erysiphe neolycopersici]
MIYYHLLLLYAVVGVQCFGGKREVTQFPLSVSTSSSSPLPPPPQQPKDDNAPSISNAINNAPHIFNLIHGAMRHWENSLKHNGMSFFPVTVEANTLLYHGDLSNQPLMKNDWLAFEVDHSEQIFKVAPPVSTSETINYAGNEKVYNYTGYLSTYRTTHQLKNILYFDGISAAKSTIGTLDTQDRVLLQDNGFKSRPGFEDLLRLQEICKILPQIEGIIRMELGFELFMCDTSKNLELLSTTSHPQNFYRNKPENIFWKTEYLRSISKEYKGLVKGKISVDFSSTLSAYFYPLNLTNPDLEKSELPRINPVEREKIQRLRDDLINLFRSQSKPQDSIDWQSIVDELVSRYFDRLAYMESSKSDGEEMLGEAKFLIERFINHTALNFTASLEQCTSVYLLSANIASTITSSDELIFEAVREVSRKICSLLFVVREKLISRQVPTVIKEVKSQVRDLMKWLNWGEWKECGKCAWNEVCFVAIWPWGTKDDHDHPNCKRINQLLPTLQYWDLDIGNNKSWLGHDIETNGYR